ncbi:MAG: hypothetical protein K6A23_03780 [Butyrivibrio sp.]|nr:hypothetical protein [Butyrivibrio sp.]
MKKNLALLLAAGMTLSLVACGSTDSATETVAETATEEATVAEEAAEAATVAEEAVEAASEEASAEETADVAVMSYEEFVAAELETEVCVETYVQAKQSWWEDQATVYTQSEEGAYFLYNMACSEEDYEKLTTGTKIRVTGYKSEWSGEVEIIDATFEIIDGETFEAAPIDVTSLLGTDDLIDLQNQYVSFTDMTVEASTDADGNEAAFLYNWDGSGSQGDDLYFNVSIDGNTYTFTVESYLCDKDSEVYQAVEALNVGDVVDMEGFLYWYEGANPHITSVVVK